MPAGLQSLPSSHTHLRRTSDAHPSRLDLLFRELSTFWLYRKRYRLPSWALPLPSSRYHTVCPLPEEPRFFLRQCATKRTTRSVLAVSHHLDSLLHTPLVGLLHPTTGRRSDSFPSAAPARCVRRLNADCLLCSPNRSFTPLEEFPSSAAALCLHSRCLLAVFTGCHSLLLAEAHNTRSLSVSRDRESRPLEIRTCKHRSAHRGS